ncbi:MAG: chitobiase/beta-hexosaminidase C-terminal domain-containing protein, partial [Oscillospiraceae bacterium]|nr:chitobiase/beta-hexosaminidase C-terminal domain-containing protein [Oscillospiraceae bacterium]
MKKVVRVLIPLFLVLVILLCTFWYLFVYDRDFTRDMLINAARSSEERGKHTLATWFYDLAYTHSSDDETVAIELAEMYKKNGNYTKAENALANAITNGGNVDLYIALCQTYIEQDKLMDAVNMLNNITNQDIKAQIDEMRPAAPTPGADQQSGIYKQYIAVELKTDGGDIYTSTTVEYPSVKSGAYTEPIPMTDGENTLYAVAVKDGLVSELAIYTYTITGVVEEVTISDSAMDTAIRETLKFASDKKVLSSDLWKIETFAIPEGAQNYDA